MPHPTPMFWISTLALIMLSDRPTVDILDVPYSVPRHEPWALLLLCFLSHADLIKTGLCWESHWFRAINANPLQQHKQALALNSGQHVWYTDFSRYHNIIRISNLILDMAPLSMVLTLAHLARHQHLLVQTPSSSHGGRKGSSGRSRCYEFRMASFLKRIQWDPNPKRAPAGPCCPRRSTLKIQHDPLLEEDRTHGDTAHNAEWGPIRFGCSPSRSSLPLP